MSLFFCYLLLWITPFYKSSKDTTTLDGINLSYFHQKQVPYNSFLSGKSIKNCPLGYYLYSNNCYYICPEGLLADNLSFTCKKQEENPIYTQAYSLSQCLNQCDSEFDDCSCGSDCSRKGNCCSDYKICEMITNYTPQSVISDTIKENLLQIRTGCTHFNSDFTLCLQCSSEYYFHDNKCLENCPSGYNKSKYNRICLSCADNCEICEEKKCLTCSAGFYELGGKCVDKCPIGFISNRVTMKCVLIESEETFKNNFYWIFPSGKSCNSMCGIKYLFSKVHCSCEYDCLLLGNCCEDFYNECYQEENYKEKCILCEECDKYNGCKKCKSNSYISKKKVEATKSKSSQYDLTPVYECICEQNYQLNKHTGECEAIIVTKNQINLNTISNSVIKSKNQNSDNKHLAKEENLISNFMNLLTGKLPKKFFKKGNTFIHKYKNNKNMKILNSNQNNKHSYNFKTTNTTKQNSNNKLRVSNINKLDGEKKEFIDEDDDKDDLDDLLTGESLKNFGKLKNN